MTTVELYNLVYLVAGTLVVIATIGALNLGALIVIALKVQTHDNNFMASMKEVVQRLLYVTSKK